MKKTISFSIQISAAILMFGFRANAASAGTTCYDVFKSRAVATTTSTVPFDLKSGIGSRGFLSASPKYDAKLEVEYSRSLISHWGIEVYIAPNIEAARAHDAAVTSAAAQGVYLIDAVADASVVNLANSAKGKEIFQAILNRKPTGVYFIFPDAANRDQPRAMVTVPPERITRDFSAEDIVLRERAVYAGPHFWLTGWTFPEPVYGVFEFADLWNSKSTHKKLMSRARGLERDGVQFGFSQTREEFRSDLEIAIDTQRRDQNTKGTAYYSKPADMANAMAAFDRGEAFTVRGVRDGKSQGGIIVYRHGNHINFSSTFYTEEVGILYPQVAAMFFFRRLEKAGLSKLYIEMVSRYSEGLKGKQAPMADGKAYSESLDARPALPFDFKSPLTVDDFGQ